MDPLAWPRAITKGNYTPGDRILVALSVTLDLPIEQLRKAAGQAEPGTPFRLPDYASRLSPDERAAIEHLVRVIVDAKDERKVTGNDNPAPMNLAGGHFPAHQDDYDLAAFEGLPDEEPGDRG